MSTCWRTLQTVALLAASCLMLLLAPSASMAATLTPDPPTTDNRTFAHWAHSQSRASVYRFPSAAAQVIGRLRLDTESGAPEVYPVLRSGVDAGGQRWIKTSIHGRPNGRTGWVRERALGDAYRITKRLVVDRARLRATLYDRGRMVWRSDVGIGAPASPTPPGSFVIREKFRVSGSTIYGPRAFGTSNYSTLTDWPGGGVVGIHGTNQPQLIPGRPSHGCIRVPNRAVVRLYDLMPIGTPVRII